MRIDPYLLDCRPGFRASLRHDGKTHLIVVDREPGQRDLRICVDGEVVAAGGLVQCMPGGPVSCPAEPRHI